MAPDRIYLIVFGVFAVVIGYDIFNWLRYRSFSTPETKRRRLISTVNLSVFMIGFTLVLASVCFHVNILDYKSPVSYIDISTITLQDFKGYRLPDQTLDGDHKFAFITTSIEWRETGEGIAVECLFHPSRSYVFNENVADPFLLEHELYHFHISEYFARQCRKVVQGLKEVPSDAVMEEIISAQQWREQEMQREYDDETYHGYIRKEQKRWMEKVDSLLNLPMHSGIPE